MLDLAYVMDPEANIWSYYGTVKLIPNCSSRLLNVNFDCPSCQTNLFR